MEVRHKNELTIQSTSKILERSMLMVLVQEDKHMRSAKLLKTEQTWGDVDLNIWVSQYEFSKRWIECEPINSLSSTKNKLYIKSKGVAKNSSCKTIVSLSSFTYQTYNMYTVQELPYMQYPAATIFFPGCKTSSIFGSTPSLIA